MSNSTIANNQAQGGLGVAVNYVGGAGGGLYTDGSATVSLTNVTVADNAALPTDYFEGGSGGGIQNDGPSASPW